MISSLDALLLVVLVMCLFGSLLLACTWLGILVEWHAQDDFSEPAKDSEQRAFVRRCYTHLLICIALFLFSAVMLWYVVVLGH